MIEDVIQAVVTYFSGFFGLLELAATILLIINVYLLGKQKLVNYWFGLAGVLIYGYIFLEFKLYSDMLLQWVFYAPLQIVGYIVWKYGHRGWKFWTDETGADHYRGKDSLPVITLSNWQRLETVLFIAFPTAIIGLIMESFTDASFPFADALTTVMSIYASILMLKKYLENWIIWIAMDVVAIYIYYAKGLYVTAGLYIVFLGLATYGLTEWIKAKRRDEGCAVYA